MQIRLIATDLDGTLVPAGGSTPERVLLTLEEAMRRGILVVPATGRTLTSIPPEISGLSGIRYIISSNGAAITDRKERRRIHETLIPAPAAAEILRRLSVYGVYSCAYIHDTVYNWSELPSFLSNYYKNLEHFHKNGKKDIPLLYRGKRTGCGEALCGGWRSGYPEYDPTGIRGSARASSDIIFLL